ncbi:MAG: hypothetical protein ACRCST_07955 [Turicibacter sp.]
MNGSIFDKIKFTKGDQVELILDSETTEGSLTISLSDPINQELFTLQNPESKSILITISSIGRYKLLVTGKHSGSYSISWTILE